MTILECSKSFKTSIEKSPELQLEFLLCQMLHKTPAELLELEKKGLLTLEQKTFLQAGILWSIEKGIGMCPFR